MMSMNCFNSQVLCEQRANLRPECRCSHESHSLNLLDEGYHFVHHFVPLPEYMYDVRRPWVYPDSDEKLMKGDTTYDTTGYDVIFTVVQDRYLQ